MFEKRKKDSLVGTLYGTPYAKSPFLVRSETGEAQSSHNRGLEGGLESAQHGLDLCRFWQHGKVASVQSRCNRREEQERP